jgi:hypothetical protein
MKKTIILIALILLMADAYANSSCIDKDLSKELNSNLIRGRHRGMKNALKSRRRAKKHKTIKSPGDSGKIIQHVINGLGHGFIW